MEVFGDLDKIRFNRVEWVKTRREWIKKRIEEKESEIESTDNSFGELCCKREYRIELLAERSCGRNDSIFVYCCC